jgi:hypothetical protein
MTDDEAGAGLVEDDRRRATIRAFWVVEIQGLRDRHDRDRRNQNLPPIQNREIADKTGIPQSTLSDLLTCKRNVVPDWDARMSLIVDCLGGTTSEWVPKWRAARAAYDDLGKSTPTPPPTPPPPARPKPKRPWRRRRTWLAVSAAVVVVVGIATWVLLARDPDGPRPATGVANARCLRVTDDTENVSVFTEPDGYRKWTEWPGKTRFWSVGQTTHPDRCRVELDNGEEGYVGKNPKYVVTAHDCP